MTLYEELEYRGLIKDVSSPKVKDLLDHQKITFYIGTDPTADSLHLGHLSSFLISKRLKDAGHHPILLIGGGTGLIGDPRPTTERPMITKEEVEKNVEALTKQVKELFGFEVVNNYDWLSKIDFIDYLRDYGKYFNVNYMLDKDIIRRRLDSGITYTEFSYMIMQATDFHHLFLEKNCILQCAGSDQWGNITAGIDLIHKKEGKEAYGFTMPLVTDKAGKKFGKSEGNALWLSKEKTSSYAMYQYLINTEDDMIEDYLKIYTFLSKEEIEDIIKRHQEHPEERIAQKALAKEIITFLHKEEAFLEAEAVSRALFTEEVKTLSAQVIKESLKDVPTVSLLPNESLLDMLVRTKICVSKREAREMVSAGAIRFNNEKVEDMSLVIDASLAIDEEVILIKKGKKNYYIGLLF